MITINCAHCPQLSCSSNNHVAPYRTGNLFIAYDISFLSYLGTHSHTHKLGIELRGALRNTHRGLQFLTDTQVYLVGMRSRSRYVSFSSHFSLKLKKAWTLARRRAPDTNRQAFPLGIFEKTHGFFPPKLSIL